MRIHRAADVDEEQHLDVGAALGATVTVPTLGGAVDMQVPPGAQTGKKLRLRGRGLPGSPAGDEYVQLKVVLPPADSPAARALYEDMRAKLGSFDPRAEMPAQS